MNLTLTKVKEKLKNAFSFLKNGNSLFYYFVFLLLVGVVFLATSLFTNYFTTPYNGDYNTQQYAFYLNTYDDWWHFIKTGSFRLYDTNTYLGVNNIGSNSFYSLTDPFFFLVLIFPREFMGQAMVISTIFRMSMNGFAFYGYLRYMKIGDKSARFAGLAFAYCGWSAWYLWFNCYTETIICFVLILWGVEKIIREKKPWVLMASLFLAGIVNYFFFVCFVLMGFIYAMFRWFQRLRLNSVKNNFIILGVGFAGFLTGILMATIIVWPSVVIALDAPRAVNASYLDSLKDFIKQGRWKDFFDYIFSWKHLDDSRDFRTYFSFIEFFFPVMSQRGTPLTRYGNEIYDNVAGSIFSYYPFMILFFPAMVRSAKNKKWSHFIAIAFFLFALFTPFFYYAFFGFTKPYARWNLFVTTSFLTYIAEYMDHFKEDKKWTLIVGEVLTVAGVILAGYFASKIVKEVDLMEDRFFSGSIMISTIVAAVYVAAISIIWFIFKNYKHMGKILYGFVVIEAGVMGALMMEGHGVSYYPEVNYGYNENTTLARVVSKINSDDPTYFRAMSSIAADSNKNDGARNGYNGVTFFHSVYNFEVKEFSYWAMIMSGRSSWSGRYLEKRLGLDKFLGVKYRFEEKARNRYGEVNVPFDFEDISDQYPNDYFYVFKDQKHIDFAFTYDNVYSYSTEEGASNIFDSGYPYAAAAIRMEEIFLRSAVLRDVDANKVLEEYEDITPQIYNASTLFDYQKIYSKSKGLFDTWESKVYKMSMVAKKMNPNQIIKEINEGTPIERPANNSGLKNVIVIEPKHGNELTNYSPNGMIFYISAIFKTNQKEDIYFVDSSDQIITYDNHNDDRTSDSTSRRAPRGFYIKKHGDEWAPIVSKIILVPRWSDFNSSEDIYFNTYDNYEANVLEPLKQYPVTDIKYRDDHFSFKTNFEKNRIVVTQIAFDKGWSIKAKLPDGTTKKIPTYRAQGGFVSFVAEKGDVSYEMDYYTPFLMEGRLVSGVGFFIFLSSLTGYLYLDDRNRNKHLNDYFDLK